MLERLLLGTKCLRTPYALLLSMLALSACVFTTPDKHTDQASERPSTRSAAHAQPSQHPSTYPSTHPSSHPSGAHADNPGSRATTETTVAALYAQLNEWRGTPYVLGGNSKRGIDCSGFVKQTFAQRFQWRLPRTTRLLVKEGRKVSRRSLQAGDLVFFKTGFRARHVGVYVDNGNFVHASSSAGVTLSNINSKYWRSHYWQSRRLPTR